MINTLPKLIAAIALLIASLALAWVAKHGVTVHNEITYESSRYIYH
jgi:hypothetical protein